MDVDPLLIGPLAAVGGVTLGWGLSLLTDVFRERRKKRRLLVAAAAQVWAELSDGQDNFLRYMHWDRPGPVHYSLSLWEANKGFLTEGLTRKEWDTVSAGFRRISSLKKGGYPKDGDITECQEDFEASFQVLDRFIEEYGRRRL